MNLQTVLERLAEHRGELHALGVESLAVFGSVARGDAGVESDVDLLVNFHQPVDLIEFIAVKQYLEQLLGCRVDLVMPDALRPGVRERAMAEAVAAASGAP